MKDEPSTVVYLYKKFCPEIFDLLNHNKVWIKEDIAYESLMTEWESQRITQNVEGILHDTSFIDVLLECEKGNPASKSFVSDMDFIVQKLIKTLPPHFHKRVRDILKGKLSNLKDWNYLNGFSELGVINTLLDYGFQLEQIEIKFPNGRPKDFLFKNKESKPVLVEVVNMHAHRIKQLTSSTLKKHIFYRLKEKIAYETEGVTKKEIGMSLMFVPVLWLLGVDNLLEMYPFFKRFEKKYQYRFTYPVVGLCSYIDHTDGKNIHIHKFGTITSLLKKPYKELSIWIKLKNLIKRLYQATSFKEF